MGEAISRKHEMTIPRFWMLMPICFLYSQGRLPPGDENVKEAFNGYFLLNASWDTLKYSASLRIHPLISPFIVEYLRNITLPDF